MTRICHSPERSALDSAVPPRRPARRRAPRTTGFAVVAGTAALALACMPSTRTSGALQAEPELTHQSPFLALAAFDPVHPGRGRDLYRTEVQDHAMAYALFASAAALLQEAGPTRAAADWLVENSGTGRVAAAAGWGLPFASDAFRDGTENPASTVYGITTALGIRALLDAHALTGDTAYANAARKALEYYRRCFTPTSDGGGYFWYSDSGWDNRVVHNVSAMLLGQYARASVLWHEPSYLALADRARRTLWKARREGPVGLEWDYGVGLPRSNDAVHAAYVVQGLLDYARASGERPALDEAIEHLAGFLEGASVREFSPRSAGLPSDRGPARLWGVGMLIYTLADAGRPREAAMARDALGAYEFRPGEFGNLPGERNFIPRAQAHVALGLARMSQVEAR